MNFYRADDAFRGLLDLYLEPALRAHLEPHLDRLGELAGGRLDELADAADKHPPVLHPRDRFGRDELKRKLVPRLLSQDPAAMLKGTQCMTEKSGGSDVGALESEARQENGEWRLYGEKWFCSHTDADLALVLA